MEEFKNSHLEDILSTLEAKRKKRKIRIIGVTILLIAIGLVFVYWAGYQSEKLKTQAEKLKTQKIANDSTAIVNEKNREKLENEQKAIVDMLNTAINTKPSIDAYNKVLELDSTNYLAY
ncbi:MAG: hypothetical protein Q8M88_06255, partial [Phenylobacterium sp.]|uniref:hypothetical protein n=1 Tax=Phenylobacterium sp. TaxID=1871053 RepID=UPI0027374178